MLTFFWYQKKLDEFVFYKVELTWRRVKEIRKDKVEEKKKKWLHKKIRGASLGVEKSSMGVQVKIFVEKNPPNFYWHQEKLSVERNMAK